MTFDGFEAGFAIEPGTLSAGPLLMPRGGDATLELALRAAGLADTMAAQGDILDRRAARGAMTVLDLRVEASGDVLRIAFDQRGADPAGGPDPTIMTPGGTPAPGEYVDSNGNGQWDPGEEQIITVTGRREVDEDGDSPGWPWEPDPGGDSGGGGIDGGVGGASQPGEEDEIARRVTLDPSIPADQRERAEQAERKLEEKVREIDQLIQALGDNAVVTVGDKSYTGAEIKALWATMTYIITWNGNFGPLVVPPIITAKLA